MPKKNLPCTIKLKTTITEAASLCVRCGLCLPHCPTYQQEHNEAESPRGRIAIASTFAKNKLDSNLSLFKHLDTCLSCGACETMCPANVPYHSLLIHTRELQNTVKPKRLPRLLSFYLNRLNWVSVFQMIYNSSDFLKLKSLVNAFALLRFLPKKLTILRVKPFYKARNAQGTVVLFKGCMTALCDAHLIHKAIECLLAASYNVLIPKNQTCCGAIHLHAGFKKKAATYLNINAGALNYENINAIVTLASGCQTGLRSINDYSKRPLPIMDIQKFLLNQKSLALEPLYKDSRVGIQIPCTQKNALKQADVPFNFLSSVGYETLYTLKHPSCCGAAGLNMLTKPENADLHAKPILQEISQLKLDYLATSNIGCALHLREILQKHGLKTQVCHPIELISLKNPKKTRI